jgi:hypothetical protein
MSIASAAPDDDDPERLVERSDSIDVDGDGTRRNVESSGKSDL